MTDSGATSTELVSGIYQGDKNAETLLVQKYSRQVLYILGKRCGDPELARDICQETFMVLLEKFRKQMIDDPEKLAAYIQQTAVNILIASKRKDARRQTFADSEMIDTYIDGAENVVNDIEKMSIRKSVRESILNMKNSRDKEILYRYYIHEHDKNEICQHLDIEFRHFDKVISRARSRLRDAINSSGKEELKGAAI